jgi:hypothetical protein
MEKDPDSEKRNRKDDEKTCNNDQALNTPQDTTRTYTNNSLITINPTPSTIRIRSDIRTNTVILTREINYATVIGHAIVVADAACVARRFVSVISNHRCDNRGSDLLR